MTRARRNLALAVLLAFVGDSVAQDPAPVGTRPLEMTGDLASEMVDRLDAFLDVQTKRARDRRDEHWDLDVSNAEAYRRSVEKNRARLREMLGADAARLAFESPTVIGSPGEEGLIAECDAFAIRAVRWPVLEDPSPSTETLPSVWGSGLLLEPRGEIVADVIAVPDANQTPEQLCGLQPESDPSSLFPLRLAASGCRVVIPHVISRRMERRRGQTNLSDREYLHRAAFVLGRTVAGYEVQKILAAADWLTRSGTDRPLGAIGYGEGGRLVMFGGAVDPRIDAIGVSGWFGPREEMWAEPLDRNLFGFLQIFDAAYLGALIAPRPLVIEVSRGPAVRLPGEGGAPGRLAVIDPAAAEREADRLRVLTAGLTDDRGRPAVVDTVFPSQQAEADRFGTAEFVRRFLAVLVGTEDDTEPEEVRQRLTVSEDSTHRAERMAGRRAVQVEALDRHNQLLIRESRYARKAVFEKLDTSSLEAYRESIEPFRQRFRTDVIGEFDAPLSARHPRSRKAWETDTWTGHKVVLDVFPGVYAYGVLLLPKDLQPGERRPVVVCQHGLEGRPTDTFLGDHRAYHNFAAKLCQRGFVVFAPQNPYIFKDRFRTLQRKAQPLGRTLFSLIVPQHQQIVNWLKSQPYVDGDRIAFYGLSYGGKSAMRIPALVTDYCLSICSADFNEWVLKNASTRDAFSYVWTGEYEIFEWNLAHTFNYAEMAALICPRPFMVERGHFDGVGVDEWVAFEYAKVRRLYAAELAIPERTEIEWFPGPHTIHGQGTFKFLHRHLAWPEQ